MGQHAPNHTAISANGRESSTLTQAVCGVDFEVYKEGANPKSVRYVKVMGYKHQQNGDGAYSVSIPNGVVNSLCDKDPDEDSRIPVECNLIAEMKSRGDPVAGTISDVYEPVPGGLPRVCDVPTKCTVSSACPDYDFSSDESGTGLDGSDYRLPAAAVAVMTPLTGDGLPPTVSGNGCGTIYKISTETDEAYVIVAAHLGEADATKKFHAVEIPPVLCEQLCGTSCSYHVCSTLTMEEFVVPKESCPGDFYDLYYTQSDSAPWGTSDCPESDLAMKWEGSNARGGNGSDEWSNAAYVVAVEAARQCGPPVPEPDRRLSVGGPDRREVLSACGSIVKLTATDDDGNDNEILARVAAYVNDPHYNSGLYSVKVSPYHCKALCGQSKCDFPDEVCDIQVIDYEEELGKPRPDEVEVRLAAWVAEQCSERSCGYTFPDDVADCGSQENPCPARLRGLVSETAADMSCGAVFTVRSSEFRERELHVVAVSLAPEDSTAAIDIYHGGWKQVCPVRCVTSVRCWAECPEGATEMQSTKTCACGSLDGTCNDTCNECLEVSGQVGTQPRAETTGLAKKVANIEISTASSYIASCMAATSLFV